MANHLEKFCGSVFWDVNLVWNTTKPDFPPCLQKTAMLWMSCGLLWLISPLEIYYMVKQKHQRVPWTALNVSKMLLAILLISVYTAELIYKANQGFDVVAAADIWAPLIKILTFILALILIIMDKIRGIHSSGILMIFWLCQTLTEGIYYRTRIIQAVQEENVPDIFLFSVTAISFPLVFAELILASFADTVIREKEDDKKQSPLDRASFLSIAFFAWFDRLVWRGFRNELKEEDLWNLDEEFHSSQVYVEFEKIRNPKENRGTEEEPSADKMETKPSVMSILWKMNKFDFCMSVFLKIWADIMSFVNPLMLRELINFVSNPGQPAWQGYFYTVVIFFASVMGTMAIHNYFFRLQSIGIKARATVIAAVYRKSLRMSTASKRTSTTGEIVNLMAVDAQRIQDFWQYIGYGLTTPIIVGVTLFLLWELLGVAVLAGLAVVLIMIPVNLFLAGRVSKMQTELMKQKDQRTKLMNEVLSGIKVLKLYAWELSFYEQINKIRQKELTMLKKYLYLNTTTTILFQFTPFLISLTTFATYVLIDENNILDASKAFVSLSLFDLLRFPLNYVPLVISFTIQALVSMSRINKFLSKPEIDPNKVKNPDSNEDPVILENASFGWDIDDSPLLQNINLKIPKGSLIAVVGIVGSGKSSLISAILGEMDQRSGVVKKQKSVAYVAQQAWIQNATLSQNIVFGHIMDEKKYRNVIEACALTPDLEILPGGDQTEIGEKGINLSGGQKQRVSLARAVYSDSELYLLDDPLSAVDSHVGKHIFEKVIGPDGVLSNKTRILVTHGLSYLPYVDKVVVMSYGKISEVGTYQELLEAGGAFADFIMTYLKEAEEIDEAEVAGLLDIQDTIWSRIENKELKRKISLRISQALSSEDEIFLEGSKSSSRRRSSGRRSSARSRGDSTSESRRFERQLSQEKNTKTGTFLIQEEQVESGNVGWFVYYYYFKSSGLGFYAIAFTVLAFSWAASVGSNIWLSFWSGDQPLPDGSQDIALRDQRLGVYGLLGSAQALFAVFTSIILVWTNIRSSTILHNNMLFNILRSPMSFFDTTPMGRVMNRFARDIDIVDSTIPTFIRPLGDSILQIIGVVIVICLATPIFGVILIPLGIVYYLIQRLFISSSRQLKRLESVTRSPIFSHFSETISGLSTIRAFARQQEFTAISDTRVDLNHKVFYPFLVAKRWLGVRLELVGATIVFFAALLAIMNRNSMDPGTVGLSVSYGLSVTFVLTFLVRYWTELESNSVSIERIKEYSQTPNEASWENEEFKPLKNWPEKGDLHFENYSTRYREGLDLVLLGISCDIHSGEKIGIVGRTGAGKSSLTLALFRIIEGVGGAIIIDGINIQKLGLHDLRSRLTIIPQDPVLFCGTLRMNLDPFGEYNDDALWKALEQSHLKEFVTGLAEGLQYEISEGGENLSIGQRQLICLARALLRKTKILILDEATAAVDLETDDLIQVTIRKEFADCTVLTIAHRLNTIMDSTRVIVLSDGRIAEFDTPSVLLQNHNSLFHSMAKDAGLVQTRNEEISHD